VAFVNIAGLAADSFSLGLDFGFQLGNLALEFVDAQPQGEYFVGLHLVAHVLETDDVGQSRHRLLAVLRPCERHCLFAHYLNIINCQSRPLLEGFPHPTCPHPLPLACWHPFCRFFYLLFEKMDCLRCIITT
jgi:hypothetical protein